MAERTRLSEQAADSTGTMAAVDSINDRAHVVIADVDAEGAWIAMPRLETPTVSNWR